MSKCLDALCTVDREGLCAHDHLARERSTIRQMHEDSLRVVREVARERDALAAALREIADRRCSRSEWEEEVLREVRGIARRALEPRTGSDEELAHAILTKAHKEAP